MSAEHDRIRRMLADVIAEGKDTITIDTATFQKITGAYLSFERDELMQAQMALRHETDQLELAEKVAGVGHWYWRVGDDNVIWSDQIFRIHGLETNLVSLEAAIDAYHCDDREQVKESLHRAMQTGDGFEFELRIVRADGSVRYVLSRGLPESIEDGKVRALFGIFQDITERVRHERLQANMRKTLQQEVQRRTRERLWQIRKHGWRTTFPSSIVVHLSRKRTLPLCL